MSDRGLPAVLASNIAYLYLVLATSIWGSLYVVARIVLETVPPLTVLFLRYAIASVALLALIFLRPAAKRARFWPEKGDRRWFALIGVLGYSLSVAFQLVGTKYAGASAASLINAMNPVFIGLFAALILRERFTVAKALAAAAAVGGAAAILGGARTEGSAWGVLFSFGSVTLWSFSSVFARRLTRKYDPLVVTAWGVAIAVACSLPAAIVELSLAPRGPLLTPANAAAFLYLGVVCTAGSHALWNKSLSMLDASVCALFYPIQPLVAVSLGVLLLGERLGPSFLAGAALIAVGVGYALRSGRIEKKR